MQYSRAEQIVGKYGMLLEHNDGKVWRPESLLPASKRDIKTAILVMGAKLRANGDLTPEGRETLRVCYATLADFVPVKQAARLGAFQKSHDWWRQWRATGADKRGRPEYVSPGEEIGTTTEQFAQLLAEFDQIFGD